MINRRTALQALSAGLDGKKAPNPVREALMPETPALTARALSYPHPEDPGRHAGRGPGARGSPGTTEQDEGAAGGHCLHRPATRADEAADARAIDWRARR